VIPAPVWSSKWGRVLVLKSAIQTVMATARRTMGLLILMIALAHPCRSSGSQASR